MIRSIKIKAHNQNIVFYLKLLITKNRLNYSKGDNTYAL